MKKMLLISGFFLAILPLFFLQTIPASAQSTGLSEFKLFPEENSTGDYATYIVAFYKFAIPVSVLVATVLIMIGGVIWITSAGNQTRISKAQEFIINPIIGVVLLFGAYLILAFINPSYVNLQLPDVKELDTAESFADRLQNQSPVECSSQTKNIISPTKKDSAASEEPTYLCEQFCTQSNCAFDKISPAKTISGQDMYFEYAVGQCTCSQAGKVIYTVSWTSEDRTPYESAINSCELACPENTNDHFERSPSSLIQKVRFNAYDCQCKNLASAQTNSSSTNADGSGSGAGTGSSSGGGGGGSNNTPQEQPPTSPDYAIDENVDLLGPQDGTAI